MGILTKGFKLRSKGLPMFTQEQEAANAESASLTRSSSSDEKKNKDANSSFRNPEHVGTSSSTDINLNKVGNTVTSLINKFTKPKLDVSLISEDKMTDKGGLSIDAEGNQTRDGVVLDKTDDDYLDLSNNGPKMKTNSPFKMNGSPYNSQGPKAYINGKPHPSHEGSHTDEETSPLTRKTKKERQAIRAKRKKVRQERRATKARANRTTGEGILDSKYLSTEEKQKKALAQRKKYQKNKSKAGVGSDGKGEIITKQSDGTYKNQFGETKK